jgi:hypothetical protein
VLLVAAETKSFLPQWLRYYDKPPESGACIISIDPVPPPSDAQIQKGLKGKDYEAISVVSRSAGQYYLLDYAVNKGHDPSWTSSKFFEFIFRYDPRCCVLSLVAAERYLKWFLEKEMTRRRTYVALKEAPIGKQSKFNRIIASMHSAVSTGKFWCSREHSEFILQFEGYGLGYRGHDDLLESVANAVAELSNPYLELTAEEIDPLNTTVEEFQIARACP